MKLPASSKYTVDPWYPQPFTKTIYFSLFSLVVFLKYDPLTICSLQVKIPVILPLMEAAVIYACWILLDVLVRVQLVWGSYQMVKHARKV